MSSIRVHGLGYIGPPTAATGDDTRDSPGQALVRELRYRSERSMATTDGGTIDPPSVPVHDPHVTDPTLDLYDATAIIDRDRWIATPGSQYVESEGPERRTGDSGRETV